jgi:copper chaperone
MRKHKIKFKQENILCHKCVMNVAKVLSQIKSIKEFGVDGDSKIIYVIYEGNKLSKEKIMQTVNDFIVSGKAILKLS